MDLKSIVSGWYADQKKRPVNIGLGALFAGNLPVAGQQFKEAAASITPEQLNQAISDNMTNLAPIGMGMLGATAYHGSPHLFNKFDMKKIGTGEGAQAYGHGLYFAENPAVAGEYIQAGRNLGFTNRDNANQIASKAFAQAKGNMQEAHVILDKEIATRPNGPLRNNFRFAKQGLEQGNVDASLMKVDIPDHAIQKMLNWDKPLSEQHPDVQKAINSHPTIKAAFDKASEYGSPIEMGYKELAKNMGGDAQASLALKQQGIHGISYLDASSRSGGKGTSNYVLFDDKLPKIVERNGLSLDEILKNK